MDEMDGRPQNMIQDQGAGGEISKALLKVVSNGKTYTQNNEKERHL